MQKNILLVGFLYFISPNLASCNAWFSSHDNPFTIDEIANKKQGKTVYLAGEVIRTINLIKSGGYLLQDSTGKIWVISSDRLPSIGDKISLKGKVQHQELPLEKQELYLQEIEVKPYSQTKNN